MKNPARDAMLLAEGLDTVRAAATKALRRAWPHRNTSFRAPYVIRANVQTLRDVQRLS